MYKVYIRLNNMHLVIPKKTKENQELTKLGKGPKKIQSIFYQKCAKFLQF